MHSQPQNNLSKFAPTVEPLPLYWYEKIIFLIPILGIALWFLGLYLITI